MHEPVEFHSLGSTLAVWVWRAVRLPPEGSYRILGALKSTKTTKAFQTGK